jgi:hypothetical protein
MHRSAKSAQGAMHARVRRAIFIPASGNFGIREPIQRLDVLREWNLHPQGATAVAEVRVQTHAPSAVRRKNDSNDVKLITRPGRCGAPKTQFKENESRVQAMSTASLFFLESFVRTCICSVFTLEAALRTAAPAPGLQLATVNLTGGS